MQPRKTAALLALGVAGAFTVAFLPSASNDRGRARADRAPAGCQEIRSLLTFTMVVEAPRPPCARLTTRNHSYAISSYGSPAGPVRLVTITPKDRSVRRTLVYLPGGPGGSLLAQSENPDANRLPLALAALGYRVVLFGYSGTAYGSAHPRSDLEVGASQVKAWLEDPAGPARSGRVAVIGVSAGASVAYEAARDAGIPLVLLSPPIDVPRTLVERMKRTPTGRAYYARRVTLSLRRPSGQRYGAEVSEEVRTAAFFGKRYDQPLAASLRQEPPNDFGCVTLIAGTEDKRIGLDALPDLQRRNPPLKVELVPGMGHGPATPTAARSLAGRVAAAIERPSCAGPRAQPAVRRASGAART